MVTPVQPKPALSSPQKPLIDATAVPKGRRNFLKSRISVFGRDLNPFNIFSAPDINTSLNEQINRSTPAPEDVKEFSKEVTDKISKKFSENAHAYVTAYWIFEIMLKKETPGESVYIEIVKEATTNDPTTGKPPGFWGFWSILCKHLTTFEAFRAFFLYFFGSVIIKDFIGQTVGNVTTELRKSFSKKEALASVLDSVIKKFHSFFADYFQAMQKYAGGSDVNGTAEDFLKKEIQGPSFIRNAEQKGFSEKEMYAQFCRVVSKTIVPRFHLVDAYKNFLNRWSPQSPWSTAAKIIVLALTAWIHIPIMASLKLVQMFANLVLDFVLTGSSLLGVEGKLPTLMKCSVDVGTQQLEGNAYTYALNTFICEQVRELKKQMTAGTVPLPKETFISDSSRKELKGLVGMLIKVLDLQKAKGSQQELAAALKKQKGLVSQKVNDAIEESLEEGLIFLCNYLTQEGKIEELLSNLMNVANSPFQADNFSSDEERQIAYRQKHEEAQAGVRDLLKAQVKDAVRSQLSGGSAKVEKKVITAFYEQFKRKSLPQVEKMQSSLKDLDHMKELTSESRESSKVAMQQVSFHASLLEVESQEMLKTLEKNHFRAASEVRKKLNFVVKLQGQLIELLRRIAKLHTLVLDRKDSLSKWDRIALSLKYVLNWNDSNLAAAAYQPTQIRETLEQLEEQDVKFSQLNAQNDLLNSALQKAQALSVSRTKVKALINPDGLVTKLQNLKKKEIETKRSKQDSVKLLMEEISDALAVLDDKSRDKMRNAIDRIHLAKSDAQLQVANRIYKVTAKNTLSDMNSSLAQEQKQVQKIAKKMSSMVEREKKAFGISQGKLTKEFNSLSGKALKLSKKMHGEVSSLRANPNVGISKLGILAAATPFLLPYLSPFLSSLGSYINSFEFAKNFLSCKRNPLTGICKTNDIPGAHKIKEAIKNLGSYLPGAETLKSVVTSVPGGNAAVEFVEGLELVSYLPEMPNMESITKALSFIPGMSSTEEAVKPSFLSYIPVLNWLVSAEESVKPSFLSYVPFSDKLISLVDYVKGRPYAEWAEWAYNADDSKAVALRALGRYSGGALLAKPLSKVLYWPVDQISNGWVFPQVWERFNSAYQFAKDPTVFRGAANSAISLVVDLNQA